MNSNRTQSKPFLKNIKLSKNVEHIVKEIFFYTFLCFWLWFIATCWIQAFKCPSMTQTQLLINSRHSIVLDFKLEDKK